MRPERLELEGFTAFRRRTVVDFAEADLFALTGPTGSGKSSLIEAIVFALYGSVPRLNDQKKVGPIVSEGAVEARVGLDFAVGHARYRVVRVVRRTPSGTASTKEARLEERFEDRPNEVLAGDARQVSSEVQRLLGLTYEHFTTAVVLPQGDFARFLHHKPSERQALLRELLDLGLYERLRDAARGEMTAAAERARLATQRLADLADATDARAAQLQQHRAQVEQLRRRCAAAEPAVAELDRHIAQSRDDLDGRHRELALLASLQRPADVDVLAAAAERSAALQRELDAATPHLEAALQAAEDALASIAPAAVASAALDRHDALAKKATELARGEQAAVEQRARLAAAAEQAHRSATELTAAEAELQAARTADAAAAIAAHLHPGDECPVCGQTIGATLPSPSSRLSGAEARHRSAATHAGDMAKAHRATEDEMNRITAKLEQVRADVDTLGAAAAAGLSVTEATDALRAGSAASEARDDARARLRRHLTAARDAATAARRAVEEQRSAWTAFDAGRDRLAALGPPPPERDDLAGDWDRLLAWAAGQHELRTGAIAEGDRALAALLDERRRQLDSVLGDAATVLGDSAGATDGLGEVRDRATQRLARLDADLERLESDRRAAAAAAAQAKEASEATEVAKTLGTLLRSDRFGAWVLDEALQHLVAAATVLLQRLTNGAYSLVMHDKDFAVVDHNNADAVRSARTLSGGETFLASLALALALADQVVTLAGPTTAPLESLFLDEGFGTLDPDTLDVVATAIEELGSQGRMVGLVTHVRELAERLPVRFEVSKGPDGASIERVLA